MDLQLSMFGEEELLEISRNQLVVKHNSLIQKTRYSLNTQQQKIVLYLISRIKPQDDCLQEYDYDIRDFCKVCGIELSGKNYQNVKDSIQKLADKSFWIETEEKEMLLRWIEKATIYKKDTRLTIKLDEDLKPFLLNLRSQFTTFELCNILLMRSKYSIRLYEYLKSCLSLESITISIEELKEVLGCDKEYTRWDNFRMRVLDKALKEINQYTDLQVSINLLRHSRVISHIEFVIVKKDLGNATITRILNNRALNDGYKKVGVADDN